MSWLLGAVIAVAVAALLLLFVTLVLLAPVWRKRREVAAPAVLWRASVAQPVQAAPVAARPVRAIPGPRTVIVSVHGARVPGLACLDCGAPMPGSDHECSEGRWTP